MNATEIIKSIIEKERKKQKSKEEEEGT